MAHLRRGVGVGALKKRAVAANTFEKTASQLEQEQLKHLQSSIATLRSSLETFARTHRDAIRKDPLFRSQFHSMCRSVGVDPLGSHAAGFWTRLLGIGDFYYELSVQVVEEAIRTREENGGIMRVEEMRRRIQEKNKNQQISCDDILQSVSKLSVLGGGFSVLSVGGSRRPELHLIKSVPLEMNVDHVTLMEYAMGHQRKCKNNNQRNDDDDDGTMKDAISSTPLSTVDASPSSSTPHSSIPGRIVSSEVNQLLRWSTERLDSCVSVLLEEGMVWIDEQDESKEIAYYFPTICDTDAEATTIT